MKFVAPTQRSLSEIRSALLEADLTYEEITNLVLSAIYYAEPKSAVDILIEQFETSTADHKSYLMVLFNTFFDMHRTIYRLDDCIRLLEAYQADEPELVDRIQFVIDDVLWAKKIYLRDQKNGVEKS